MLVHMAASALAHEGHGLPEASHWHATDTWGFLGIGVALIVAILLARGGRP